MKAIIFLNGNPPSDCQIKTVVKHDCYVICADGAFNYLSGIIVPNLILGDFDSVKSKNFPKCSEVEEYCPEKDYTDGELCLLSALERGYTEIEIYGAFGGRPDHEYANYGLLKVAKNGGAKAKLVDGEWEIELIDGTVEKQTSPNKYVSMVPFNSSAHIIRTEGLKYSANQVRLKREQSLGVSNQAQGEKITVSVEGEMLLFIQK